MLKFENPYILLSPVQIHIEMKSVRKFIFPFSSDCGEDH